MSMTNMYGLVLFFIYYLKDWFVYRFGWDAVYWWLCNWQDSSFCI